MRKFLSILAIACCLFTIDSNADAELAAGKILVATEEVRGPTFAKTVILLIQYDGTGAMGFVINLPAEMTPTELLPELQGLDDYEGTVYWGGPIELSSMRALYKTNSPPDGAIPVFDTVHRLPLNKELPKDATSTENLRFFVGYTGWAPGQLDREMLFGSWTIIEATDDIVFAEDVSVLWKQLAPPRHYRASIEEPMHGSIRAN
jgi:putative transcriptional regulator